jgi:hypothetical protein
MHKLISNIFYRLVEATLQYGLVPPVVMEFPGITGKSCLLEY